MGGSDPSDPTPGELLKCYKAEDIEIKDRIEKKNIKLVGERLRICTWRTGDRVIIRIACVTGRMVTRGVPKLVAAPALGRQKTATLPCQSREPRRLVHRIP